MTIKLLSGRELAKQSGVSRSTISNYKKAGIISPTQTIMLGQSVVCLYSSELIDVVSATKSQSDLTSLADLAMMSKSKGGINGTVTGSRSREKTP